MDSISQAALGAAVGEAVLGREVGNKAILWGAIAGTLPDLDVLAHPFMTEVAQLSWHRGWSHSLIIHAIVAPLFGWLLWRLYKRRQGSYAGWTTLALLGLWTHALLDAFTVYGTQLFRGMTDHPFGWNAISIIDPLYTLPLVVGMIMVLVSRRNQSRRFRWNTLGLAMSTLYLAIAVGVKMHVTGVFQDSLRDQGIAFQRTMTTPTLFNIILWRCTAEAEAGYHVGYYSLLDKESAVDTRFIARNEDLLLAPESEAVKKLRWFSRGYYTVTMQDTLPVVHDLRFGKISVDSPESDDYIFSWVVYADEPARGSQTARIEQVEPSVKAPGRVFQRLFTRIQGTH
jgi:inner membrane protein